MKDELLDEDEHYMNPEEVEKARNLFRSDLALLDTVKREAMLEAWDFIQYGAIYKPEFKEFWELIMHDKEHIRELQRTRLLNAGIPLSNQERGRKL